MFIMCQQRAGEAEVVVRLILLNLNKVLLLRAFANNEDWTIAVFDDDAEITIVERLDSLRRRICSGCNHLPKP